MCTCLYMVCAHVVIQGNLLDVGPTGCDEFSPEIVCDVLCFQFGSCRRTSVNLRTDFIDRRGIHLLWGQLKGVVVEGRWCDYAWVRETIWGKVAVDTVRCDLARRGGVAGVWCIRLPILSQNFCSDRLLCRCEESSDSELCFSSTAGPYSMNTAQKEQIRNLWMVNIFASRTQYR